MYSLMSFDPLSAEELLKQRQCCGCGCHNCPYITKDNQRNIAGTTAVNKPFLQFIKTHPQKHWQDFVNFLQERIT